MLWFEKFNWCLTREGVLVLSGRDAHQNEILVKRYLRKSHGDVYVHADLHGAPSCIVRNPRKGREISPESLREAGIMTVCRSSAWTSKVVTSAWWVQADQVSKTAPTGEYLPTGSFMIRGKKNFLPPCRLELSFGYIFKIDETLPSAKDRPSDWRLLEDVEKEALFEDKLQDAIQRSAVKTETNTKATPNVAASHPPKPPRDKLNDATSEQSSNGTGGQGSVEVELSEGEAQESSLNQPRGTSAEQGGPKGRLSARERKALKQNPDNHKEAAGTKTTGDIKEKGKKPAPNQQKRGRRGKEKKKKKYAEQTEEERKLAMAALGNPIVEKEAASEDTVKATNEHEAEQKKNQMRQKQRRIKDMEELDAEDMERLNTSEFNHRGFTYDPKPDDSLLYALPVCGPTSSMLGYKFRVKLLPGSTKKGKAAKAAVELFGRLPTCTDRERGLLRAVQETSNIQTMVGSVKLSAPGINSANKASKAKKKKAKAKAK